MYDTVVVATDGSESVERAASVATDLAERFDAELHALYVLDSRAVADAPEGMVEEVREGLAERGREATADVESRLDRRVRTAIREGRPADEIVTYVREVEADLVATGTRGRHGERRFIVGSVAEEVVRTCPAPVLTVRRLAEG